MRSPLAGFRDLSRPRNVSLISATHGVNEFFSIAIPPVIPFLVADLDVTYAEAGLLLTVFFVMYSVFQLPAGLLGDRVGKKPVLVGGMVGMAGGVFLASTAATYELLVVAQAVAGIAGSTYHPMGMSMISDFETEATEGKAMGVFGFGGTLGTAAAPLVIGGIAGLADWRLALVAAAVLGVAVTSVFAVFFTDPDADGGAECDGGEHADAGPARGVASPDDPVDPDDGTEGGDESTAGGADADDAGDDAAAVQHDGGRTGRLDRLYRRAVDATRIPLTPGVTLLLFLTAFVSMQARAVMTFTTSYVFAGIGGAVSTANVVFFVMLVAGSVSSLAVGSLADRLDRGRLGFVASLVTGVLIVATLALVESAQVSRPLLVGSLLVTFFAIGAAMYGTLPVKNALISQYAEREFSGSLFGVTQTTGALGSATGPALFGYLATEYGMTVAYPMIAVLSLAVAAVFLLLSRADAADPAT